MQKTVINEIKNYLLNNMDELKDVVVSLNSWDGSLEHLDIYYNDKDFFNMHFNENPMEAVRASYYGDYNYMDEFVRFNGYGNLESLTEHEYEEELKESIDEIVDSLIENQAHIHCSDELEELLEELEEEENDVNMTKIVNYNEDTLKEFAESIAFHYVFYTQYRSKPRIFIYDNKLHFDTNSPVFGSSEIMFNHESECEVVFDDSDLQDVLEDLDIDVDNLEEHEEEIASAVKNKLEQKLEYYVE